MTSVAVEMAAAPGAWRCPKCGTYGQPGDRYCEVDGARLAPTVGGSICACVTPKANGSGLCVNCGQPFVDSASRTTDQSPHDAVLALAPTPEVGAATDTGRRHAVNQDAVAVAREIVDGDPADILVVADGVSTAHHSDRASAVAVQVARDALVAAAKRGRELDHQWVSQETIEVAHRAIGDNVAWPAEDYRLDPPGTTIVTALVWRGEATIGWVGDSRAYWVARNGAGLLTRDHNFANEAIDTGHLTELEARQSPDAAALIRCLGPIEELDSGEPPQADVVGFRLPNGATGPAWLILCSDGFWNYAPEPAALAAVVNTGPVDESGRALALRLVNFANANGGRDNISVAVTRLK